MMNPSADKESSSIDPAGFRQASDPLIKLLSNQNMSCPDLSNRINTVRNQSWKGKGRGEAGSLTFSYCIG